MLRKFHATVDMLPQVMIAGVISLVVAFALAPPFAATGRDLAVLALMGCVQLGTGCLLATAASKHLSATELGLLALLEPILGPLWVWALLAEQPGPATLVGAVIVLSAVIANEVFAAWRSGRPRRGQAAAAPAAADGRRVHWPDFPLAFYPVAVVAILITGISKGGFGGGSGGIAVPLMSIFIAPPEAAGIMLPILCAMDLFGVHAYRGRWSKAHLAVLLPGAVIGIAAGGLAFGALPVNAIRLLLGVIAVTFALNRWFRLSERLSATARRPRGAARAPRRLVLGRRVGLHQHAGARGRPARSRSGCCRRSWTRRCWSARRWCSSSSSTTSS